MLAFQFYTFGLIYFWQSQLLKSEPIFSQNTKNKAENVVLYENIPLNTGNLVAVFFICFFKVLLEILIATASTSFEAYPINYSLIDTDGFFKIDSSTGSVSLIAPFNRQVRNKK